MKLKTSSGLDAVFVSRGIIIYAKDLIQIKK